MGNKEEVESSQSGGGRSLVPLPPESPKTARPLEFLGSSEDDLSEFPPDVKTFVGFALRFAQRGGRHPSVEPLKGYSGAGVLDIIKRYDTDTFRVVYTVKFEEKVYVLHAFQKKSNTGIATPLREMNTVKARLTQAQAKHDEWLKSQQERRKK